LNLNYINTKTIPIKVSATSEDIDDFYKKLNPWDFKRAGGSVASTDIERMFKMQLDLLNERSIQVFISDCVFSPGSGKDAKKFLDGQYALIYNDFVAARKTYPDLSVIVLQCVSRFEGTYYDHNDVPYFGMDMERPYYIWFIGKLSQIKSLVDQKLLELIKNGYKNKLIFQSVDEPLQIDYKILYSSCFKLRSGAKGPISSAKPCSDRRKKGLFWFHVAADFSQSLQDRSYFLDLSNYELSGKYSVQIKTISPDTLGKSLEGYTHLLRLETNELKDETLEVSVVGKTPSWVYASTSSDDSKIAVDENEKQKTLGLKYLVEGVADAFYPKSASNELTRINIAITK
jgi:hypothetical protein